MSSPNLSTETPPADSAAAPLPVKPKETVLSMPMAEAEQSQGLTKSQRAEQSQALRNQREPGDRKDFHQKMFKTPKETTAGLKQASQNKAELPLLKLMLLSFLSGVFIAFGGTLAIMLGKGIPTWPAGVQKLIFGSAFSVGLIFIVLFGGELFTGNCMIMFLGLISRAITWQKFSISLTLSFIFNFLGCVFAGAFLVYFAELFDAEPYLTAVKLIAEVKCALPPHVVFLRGIGANWLVNLAIFMGAAAETIEGKILAIFIPIMTFTSIGYEHSVANMFFVPLGLFYGAETDFGTFIYRNLILTTLGNFIGGGIGVGAAAWYVYIYSMPVAPLKKPVDPKIKMV